MSPEIHNNSVETFLEAKKRRMWVIYSSTDYRQRLVDTFYKDALKSREAQGDCAIILGTSLYLYPDKFKKRVYWGSMLLLRGRVNRLIFTGLGDHETSASENQAEDARDMAFTEFGVPLSKISLVGGSNTQQNMDESRPHILPGETVLLVTDTRHMVRSISAARDAMGKEVNVLPSTIGGVEKLDPFDPRVVIELIKAEGYHHAHYRTGGRTDEEIQLLKAGVNSQIKYYENALTPFMRDGQERPFEQWVQSLSSEYTIPIASTKG